ncbi:helix-turn-helix transcriptional regulator [Agromyces sp. Marseille-P2726]|uniref:helix-turn-helix transcriptional regulator n=1 Tax=Agromyces sp. Marseille-P2726 TaxID=2709132 RepID=UPI001C2DED7F|nr:helix-turn-helix transcriptional regulator [Agromyces sp. Marseille-P2726]
MGAKAQADRRLTDRRDERARLDQLIAHAHDGTSGALVVRGTPGIGKTALLDYLLRNAAGCRILRTDSVESEMELAFSGLHQLCAPLLDHLDSLPEPQRDALATAFGLRAGNPTDKFLVGLAVLTLLSHVAEEQPLVCLIDDAQWLDRVSAQVLGFVARRLAAESVVLVFAARDGEDLAELAGLPELTVSPLRDRDARALAAAVIPGRLDESVRDRIIAEAGGNPLALLELPKSWSASDIAGGYGLPDSVSVPARVEESFRRRLDALPNPSRQLLLIAAAEPVGDTDLIRAAAERMGIAPDAAVPARAAGLFDGRSEVGFRHPLVRSVVYRESDVGDRRRVHAVLAEATNPEADPDRRAWHLAAASDGPDEEVASALEHSAGRAQARGGLSAAAAFLQRSAALTPEPERRTARTLAAAQACFQAGAFDDALALLDRVEGGQLNTVQVVLADLLRAHVAFASGFGSEAPPMLVKAARQVEAFDPEQGRQTYLIAWVATVFAGHHAGPDDLADLCRTILSLPPRPGEPRALDLLLEGVARLILEGHRAAATTLQRAAQALAGIGAGDVIAWGWAATAATDATWDPDGTRSIAESQSAIFRRAGALGQLSIPLAALGNVSVWTGDLAGAASIAAEATSVAASIGSHFPPTVALRLAAARGDEREAEALIGETLSAAGRGGQGMAATNADWAAAVLYNGLARYGEAMAAAERATSATSEPFVSVWALPELVEAAARAGDSQRAAQALARLVETTQPCDTDSAAGIEARSRALVSEGDAAEDAYREAVHRLGRTPLRPELARAYLLHGEWLRREGRRIEARDRLRTASRRFTAIGRDAFAGRARRELVATGEHVRRRGPGTRDALTPQEEQIARLARDGHSNPEISAQLFLSPRTVEWHLRKVFHKLGIASRKELRQALMATRTVILN